MRCHWCGSTTAGYCCDQKTMDNLREALEKVERERYELRETVGRLKGDRDTLREALGDLIACAAPVGEALVRGDFLPGQSGLHDQLIDARAVLARFH